MLRLMMTCAEFIHTTYIMNYGYPQGTEDYNVLKQ